jgi:thiamine-phosphate pyrophosphorylase
MEIILLSPEGAKWDEIAIINRLFEAGLQRFHLRKKGFTVADYRRYLSCLDEVFLPRVVLHGGGFELYGEFPVAGIHLSGADRNNVSLRQQIAHIPVDHISTSFHAWSEISHDPTDYGYVFMSPVFDSISKTNYQAAVDLRGLAVLRRKFEEKERQCPRICALGGVDAPHLPILKQYRFDGAAIYGAIWKSAHPDTVFERLLVAAQ